MCAENYIPNIKLAISLRRITKANISILEDGFATLFLFTYKRVFIRSPKELYLSLMASIKCFDYIMCED